MTQSKALLWTDGRYFLQATKQLDASCWELMKAGTEGVPRLEEWLAENLGAGQKVGFDPFLISGGELERMRGILAAKKVGLVPVDGNLVDQVWPLAKAPGASPAASPAVDSESKAPPSSSPSSSSAAAAAAAAAGGAEAAGAYRPADPKGPVVVHLLEQAGKSVPDKLTTLRANMRKKGAFAAVFCALDEIAWLFNLRGSDIAFNPVFMSYAVVTQDSATLYVDQSKLDQSVTIHLYSSDVATKPYGDVLAGLRALGDVARARAAANAEVEKEGKTVDEDDAPVSIWLDPARSNVAVQTALGEKVILSEPTSVTLAKAIKNEAELRGMINCHIRDAISVSKFFAWLEKQLPTLPSASDAPEKVAASPLTEFSVTTNLEAFRAEWDEFR